MGHSGEVGLPVRAGQGMAEAVCGGSGCLGPGLGGWLCSVRSKRVGDVIPVPGEHDSVRGCRGRPQQASGADIFHSLGFLCLLRL